jgi:molybdate transport system substrate-binding protein
MPAALSAPSAVFALSRRASHGIRRRVAAGLRSGAVVALGIWCASALAAELRIAAPNAIKESLMEIAAGYERSSGHKVVFTWAGSEAISKRVGEGEVFDAVFNTAQGVDRLAADGKLAPKRTDFARSGIGVAVREGQPRPDISTADALRQALVSAKSVAISSGASGRYLEGMFQQLGVADQVRPRIKQPPSGAQIAEMVARGEVELGFQQVTELVHAKGISYLGPLPAALQNNTTWSAGVHTATPQATLANEFLQQLRAPDWVPAVRKTGLEPM